MVIQRNSFLKIGVIAVVVILVVSFVINDFLLNRGIILPGMQPRACTLEAQICPDGTAVGRTGLNCEFAPCTGGTTQPTAEELRCTPANLRITQPTPNTHVAFPIMFTGTVDNRTNKDCSWTLFEGQAGTIEIRDVNGVVVGTGVLEALDDWMSEGPINVEGTVELTTPPQNSAMSVTITEENPSGLGSGQQIRMNLIY